MTHNDYKEAVLDSAKGWIDECDDDYILNTAFDHAMDYCRLTSTGNDSGSFYCNSVMAEEAVRDVMFDSELMKNICDAFGSEFMARMFGKGAESLDVVVREFCFDEVYDRIRDYWYERYDSIVDADDAYYESLEDDEEETVDDED